MRVYLAPMEGITGYLYRQAVHQHFGGFEKYFVPFIRATENGRFSARDKNNIVPENSVGMRTVPQILANNADYFLHTANLLSEYGYREINLNLGCPSKTVVGKGCGAGFLAHPEALNRFLDRIFSEYDGDISIKTRLGMRDAEDFGELLDIYNQYPVKELIIHARVQKDFYQNTPNLVAFALALEKSRNPVCYNGDIFTVEDALRLQERFSHKEKLDTVMTGRGVLANPALGRELHGGKPLEKNELKAFHDTVYHAYQAVGNGEKNVLFKMKELWFYMAPTFTNYKKYAKKIKKSEHCIVYEAAVNELFANEEIQHGKESDFYEMRDGLQDHDEGTAGGK